MSIEGLRRWFLALALSLPAMAQAQDPASARQWPSQFKIDWNEYNLGFSTITLGAAVLVDYATYNQDSASASRFDLERQGKIRDSRFLFNGTLNTSRSINWSTGIMYDWAASKWRVRQTMFVIAVPELSGWINIGRMKDGVSLNRIMVGYDGWTSERFTFSDAAIPLLADGVKWIGYAPRPKLSWQLAAFTNWLSEPESFSYFKNQVVGRLARVTMDTDTSGSLLHLGAALHVGEPQHDTLQLKSKPEVNAAPNFIDTGKFPATFGSIGGVEAYYRNGPFLIGTEYYGEWTRSTQTGNPFFHGGDISASWVATGETRPYTTNGGYFRTISPKRSVFRGGRGAFETVLRFSYIDLNSDSLRGGTFWRATPMVNWYMSDAARLEVSYGFSNLHRFGTIGGTEFFQVRLQLEFAKLGAAGD